MNGEILDSNSITVSLPVELPINSNIIAFCVGRDSFEEWELGGVSGHASKSHTLDPSTLTDFMLSCSSDGEPPKNKHVLDQAAGFFLQYINDDFNINEHFSDYQFFFVIGVQRSGGTYLLTQLYEAVGIDFRSLSRSILRDSIPRSRNLFPSETHPMKIMKPLFEFFQLLAWGREVPNNNFLIQKNVAYAHWMRNIDKIIGKRATYLITVRQPLAYMASYIQVSGGLTWGELMASSDHEIGQFQPGCTVVYDVCRSALGKLDGMSALDILLLYWKLHYMDIVRHIPEGEIIVFEYGNPSKDFFEKRFPQYLDKHPEGLEWTPDNRDYGAFAKKFEIDLEKAQKSVEAVQTFWRDRGHKFPDLSLVDRI